MACTKKRDEWTNERTDERRQNNMPHQFHSKRLLSVFSDDYKPEIVNALKKTYQ